jgi:hypothetical protein
LPDEGVDDAVGIFARHFNEELCAEVGDGMKG